MKRLVQTMAGLLVLLVWGTAGAAGFCTVTVIADCDRVSVAFSNFPDDGHTVVRIGVDGTRYSYEFDGSVGLFTVGVPDGDAPIDVVVKGKVTYDERVKHFHQRSNVERGCMVVTPSPSSSPPTIPPPDLVYTGAPSWLPVTIIALVVGGAVALAFGRFARGPK